MEKKVKIAYSLVFTGLAAFIIYVLIFTSSISQTILPSPGDSMTNWSAGSLQIILITVSCILVLVLIYFAFSHYFWKIEEKRNEWKASNKEEEKKRFCASNVSIIRNRRFDDEREY